MDPHRQKTVRRARVGLLLRTLLACGLLLVGACYPWTQAQSRSASDRPLPSLTATAVTTAVSPPFDLSPFEQAMTPAARGDVARYIAAARPTRYLIDVHFDPETRWLVGQARVVYTNNEPVSLRAVYFRLFPNLPDFGQAGVAMLTVDGQVVTPRPELKGTALRVVLPQTLRPSAHVTFELEFAVEVPATVGGNYGSFAFANDVLALAGFYPMIPVYDDEGWNLEIAPSYGDIVFSDTSLYLVNFTLPAGWQVAASGSTLAVNEHADGTATWTIASGLMRDFTLVASPLYEISEQRVGGGSSSSGDVVVRSYYKPDDAAGGRRVLAYAADALAYFGETFGPYPFAELDVAATPTLAAGIEYPGLIVIADRLYDETDGFLEWAVVHETAHQWWYSLVGNDQVDEPWLDEALSQYATLMYIEHTKGKAAAQAARATAFEEPYRRLQEAGRDQAVGQPVRAFRQEEYGPVVYSKGPLFFDALRTQIGETSWRTFLRNYLATYRYGIATPQGLLGVAQAVCRCDLYPLYRRWIVETTRN